MLGIAIVPIIVNRKAKVSFNVPNPPSYAFAEILYDVARLLTKNDTTTIIISVCCTTRDDENSFFCAGFSINMAMHVITTNDTIVGSS